MASEPLTSHPVGAGVERRYTQTRATDIGKGLPRLAASRATAQTDLRSSAHLNKAHERLPFLMQAKQMFIRTGHHIGLAAQHTLQSLRPRFVRYPFHLNAHQAKEPHVFGHRQWQVIKALVRCQCQLDAGQGASRLRGRRTQARHRCQRAHGRQQQ